MNRAKFRGVLFLLAILGPVAGLAQAVSYEIGGSGHQVGHQVDILNCCAHFTMASDSTPQTTLTVSGPPWPLQPFINGEYGSATATSSTQISGSNAGASLTAVASGSASPGILPGWALRASSSQGGTYYSFVLDQAAYVEMHGSAGYAHSPGASFAASVALRVGSAGGAAVSGFSLDVNSSSNPGFTSTTINAPPVLLGPGTYVLVGSLSSDANAYATGNAENVSANLSVTLLIHSAPDGAAAVGTAGCISGSPTITRPGGSPLALGEGTPVFMGDTLETGAADRACIVFVDGTQFSLGQNTRLKVDEYVYDPNADRGVAHYTVLEGIFRYVSGLISHRPDPDIDILTPTGGIGIRGTKFIGEVGATTDTVHLAEGTVASTPWHTGVATVTNALATITMSDTGVATSALSQASYDALEATLIDTDGDGTVDASDDCTLLANPTQLDSDGDGYGNACDADLNNSGLVTATDFNLLRSVLNATAGSSALAAAADMNGSGLVTSTDFNLLRARLNTAPGPSGLHP